MKITTQTSQINVSHSGNGAPIWVLLHGFMGTEIDFEWLKPRLSGSVICPDLLGHGATVTQPETAFSMANQVEALHDMLGQLYPQNVTYNVVGYSMGGRVAIAFAAQYPDLIAHLFVESGRPGLASAQERADRQAHDAQLATQLETTGLTNFVDRWEALPLFATQRNLPAETQQRVRAGRLAQAPQLLAKSLREMGTGSQPDYWSSLATFTFPVTLITGQQDEKFTKLADAMMTTLPNAQHRVVTNAGHNVHLEQPEAFLDILTGGD
ncbi:hypothetical protein AYR62_00645 [Secundilactobacillus paracollinoides]|uniref:Putative 2-succinyl-6-hydroxy-2,4-cyclohexadiene-1-carboxylate synthase n=1 Tax=Secundilactobacillus paracollinoides TaxID=240427 RepID=A0A1B2IVL7_9LACO|nr:2-succinyl-6-hydroxy-2,4-cyclohexadiene-1-carboxylate synthase [Secundilactobacillus paracollinoides]ANZ60262.1 hypothetical protein AYR61_02100 [Secundilactobacillus paracollinoides]ANZ62750.1 hypothetical protein AYR62_00645 [Secundilactobacillus paracollinoides]ANZ66093.1 hypothetical protein AYR63_02305 [Secundilactobacillus paracollinoides]